MFPRGAGFSLIAVAVCLLAWIDFAPWCLVAAGVEGERVILVWENDAVIGTDRHYTQGARLSYSSRDNALPGWMNSVSRRLPAWGFSKGAEKYGIGLGQEIYTPTDLSSPFVVMKDRPYAAWLYGRLTLERRGTTRGAVPVMEVFHFDLGVVGPEALGEEAQDVAHRTDPRGWSNQLRTEPGLALRYGRTYQFAARDDRTKLGVDFLPSAGASLGNVSTGVSLGSTLRFGYNVPNEFQLHNEPGGSPLGLYAFVGAEGRWVARNIFLDGNTFRHSHSVDKIPFVADFRGGASVVAGPVEFTTSYVLRSPEFFGQRGYHQFGSATMTVRF